MTEAAVKERFHKGSSFFASLPCVFILFIGFLAAEHAGARILAGIFLAAFFLFFLSWLWGTYSLKNVTATVEGRSVRVFPGRPIRFSVTIENKKVLPLLWLDVILPQPRAGLFMMREEAAGHFRGILPWQSLTWECEWTGRKRGVYLANEAALLSGDGFGLSVVQGTRPVESPLLFVIYPEIFPVRTEQMLRVTAEESFGSRGYIEDLTLLRSTRDYIPGDPVKRINWRLLARTQKTEVNLYEEILPKSIAFMVDLTSFVRYDHVENSAGRTEFITQFHREELEQMLSLTASCMMRLAERKSVISLLLPTVPAGAAGRPEIKHPAAIAPAPDEEMIPSLLTALSSIEYDGIRLAFDPSSVRRTFRHAGQLFAVVYSEEDMTCGRELEQMTESRVCLLTFTGRNENRVHRCISFKELKEGDAAP